MATARLGCWMSDPLGKRRRVYTPYAVHMADHPERLLIAGVAGSSSPISVADTIEFGDSDRHAVRTTDSLLRTLSYLDRHEDSDDVLEYGRSAEVFYLNGVKRIFWLDWKLGRTGILPEMSTVLTPDILHGLIIFFHTHVFQWIRNLLGDAELDFRMSILQPRVGRKNFLNGCTHIRQITGKEKREIASHILASINGAEGLTRDIIRSIRFILDFIYLAQYESHDDVTLGYLASALHGFHEVKGSIIEASLRGSGKEPIENFNIPKLEMLQHVVHSITNMGTAPQYSTDFTERALIGAAKAPFIGSNRRQPAPQMCRFLDRREKLRIFDNWIGAGFQADVRQLQHRVRDRQPSSSRKVSQSLRFSSLLS